MQVDVWSDVLCPWCAVGRKNLEDALASFEGEEVQLRWRSFELDPSAPKVQDGDYLQRLADKYGTSRDQAKQMVDQMTERGRSVGVEMDFDRARPGNSFDAHRLLHLAHEHGVQDALKQRLFHAYLAEGVAIGDPEALVPLAVEVGLDEAQVREVLEGEAYAPQVRGEEQLAMQLGIRAVPFFVLDQRVAVQGAQPPEVLLQALQHAVDSREPVEDAFEAGAACGPEGCD